MKGRFDWAGARGGGCLSFVLVALSSNNIIKLKEIVELTNYFFSRLDH